MMSVRSAPVPPVSAESCAPEPGKRARMRVRRVGIRCRANRMLETGPMLVQHDRDSPDQTVLLIAKQGAENRVSNMAVDDRGLGCRC